MECSIQKEKISPTWASRKGRRPTWNSQEESRHHWRRVFFIRGIKAGKRVTKKRKKWSRETIRYRVGFNMSPEEIRQLRKAIGVNRKAFGKLIGVKARTAENYEQGRHKPSAAVMINIKRIKIMHEKGALRI